MAKFSLMKPASPYNVRSRSFPGRSHPTTLRIQEEINKLRSLESVSSSTISTALSGLAELYTCMGDLLGLPLTQQGLSQHEKWVSELLDGTLRYLDICGNTRDSVLLTKESVRELQSALRRSIAGELSVEDNVRDYTCARKNMKKETTQSLALLKQMENGFGEFQFPLLQQNHQLSVLVQVVLREASLVTISTLRSLLLFLSPSLPKPKGTKWLLVSKLVRRGIVSREGREEMKEVQSAKVAVGNLTLQNASEDIEVEKIESALGKLEALCSVFEDFEVGLELLFRCLIHCRVSLLNIVSC